MKKFLLVNLCLCVIFFQSCVEKIDSLLIEENSQDFFMEDGYLSFENDEALELTLKMLGNFDSQQIKEWEKQHQFKSMKSIYNSLLSYKSDNPELDNQAFYEKYPNIFHKIYEDIYTVNTYRDDISILLNENGMIKVGPILYSYSYDGLKWTTTINDENIRLLLLKDGVNLNDDVFYSEVTRQTSSNNARTAYNYSHSIYVVESPSPCEKKSRMTASLVLATVAEPQLEYVCRPRCDPGQLCDQSEVCTWEYTHIRYTNYFEAAVYVDLQGGFCNFGSYNADNRYKLKITGSYYENGIYKSFFNATDIYTSTLRHTMFRHVYTNTQFQNIDITQAQFYFDDLNNPKPRHIEISFI